MSSHKQILILPKLQAGGEAGWLGGAECGPHPELLLSPQRCAVMFSSEGCWAGARALWMLREWVLWEGRGATALCSITTPPPRASHTLISTFLFFCFAFQGSSFYWRSSGGCGDGVGANGVSDRERAQEPFPGAIAARSWVPAQSREGCGHCASGCGAGHSRARAPLGDGCFQRWESWCCSNT